ncbi:TraK family protein [Nitrosomonas communis]|uniref:TraK family protein n=1 Tax=Nitrosomonas communis TaxID=44574 RepID=UPI003D2C4FDA
MNHSLSERIAAKVGQNSTRRGKQSFSTFLALRTEIKQAMDDGWSIKLIWQTLTDEKKINFSYQRFLLLVKKQGLTRNVVEQIRNTPHQASPSSIPATKNDQADGFVFNPSINQEELI